MGSFGRMAFPFSPARSPGVAYTEPGYARTSFGSPFRSTFGGSVAQTRVPFTSTDRASFGISSGGSFPSSRRTVQSFSPAYSTRAPGVSRRDSFTSFNGPVASTGGMFTPPAIRSSYTAPRVSSRLMSPASSPMTGSTFGGGRGVYPSMQSQTRRFGGFRPSAIGFTTENVRDRVSDRMDNRIDIISDRWDNMEDRFDRRSNWRRNSMDNVNDRRGRSFGGIRRRMNNSWDRRSDRWDNIKDRVENRFDRVEDRIDNVSDRIEDRWDRVSDRVEDRVDNIKDIIENRVDRIDDNLDNVKDRIEDRFDNVSDRFDNIGDVYEDRIDNVKDIFDNRFDRISDRYDTFSDMLDNRVDAIGDFRDNIRDFRSDRMDNNIGRSRRYFSNSRFW